jgi:putative transposase
MDALEDLPPGLAIARACNALGASRATLYRRTAPPAPPTPRLGSTPRALGEAERTALLDALHSDEFVDQPPREVYAALLSRGTYLGSVRTMYRLLAREGESQERRRGHQATRRAVPQLEATRPNQIWTWDITKVHGTERGAFYFVFVILDLFSRFVVGWLVAETENAKLATHLIAETVRGHGIEPGTLTIHSDRGSPMRLRLDDPTSSEPRHRTELEPAAGQQR